MKRLIAVFILFTACADANGPHKPISARTPSPQEVSETFANETGYSDVRGIFARQCSLCHPSRNGPDWLDYNQAKRYAENGLLVRRVVTERSMPPPGSPQAASITEVERKAIGEWAMKGGKRQSRGPTVPQDPIATAQDQQEESDPNILPEARQCLQCHGLDGPQAGARLKIPRLAGQNSQYLFQQLMRFRWRERIDPTNSMNDIAGEPEMTNETMRKLSDYFATRPAFGGLKINELSETQNTKFLRGKSLARESCVQCHMNMSFPRGTSDPSLPALAGQSEEYLRTQLIYFRDNERQSPLMHEFARGLKNDDIDDLAFYFSAVRDSRRTEVEVK